MDSRDFYCALCGSTFSPDDNCLARQPHSRFLRKQQRKTPKKASELSADCNQEQEEDNESDGDYKLFSVDDLWDATCTYDPDLISQEDLEWLSVLRCLAFDNTTHKLNKVYLSGPGTAQEYGVITLNDDDPQKMISAYNAFDAEESAIPFHYPCFDILLRVLSHKAGTTYRATNDSSDWEHGRDGKLKAILDKDLMYNVFGQFEPKLANRLERIDYGHPDPPLRQYWSANPGLEVLAAHPTENKHPLWNRIYDAWEDACEITPSAGEMMNNRRDGSHGDVFAQLPAELLFMITTVLDSTSLVHLIQASPHVYEMAVDSGPGFWFTHFKKCMPWFSELHAFVEEEIRPRHPPDRSFYRLFNWCDYTTTAYEGMRGPFLGVANRRRIWGVCSQLADIYLSRCKDDTGRTGSSVRDTAECVAMPVVSFPAPAEANTETVFWVDSLREHRTSVTLGLFWSLEKSLIGISLERDGKSAMFGRDTSSEGVTHDSMTLQVGEWIEGLVLHYPQIVYTNVVFPSGWWTSARMNTSIKAVTVRLSSGRAQTFGHGEPAYAKRLLTAQQGCTVVGLTGQVGTVSRWENAVAKTKQPGPSWQGERITRLGVLQARGREPDPASEPDSTTHPSSIAWVNVQANHHGDRIDNIAACRAIWDTPGLYLLRDKATINQVIPDDLVAHSALIWGLNETELASLTCLGAYKRPADKRSGWDSTEDDFEYTFEGLCGMKVEYTSSSGLPAREIGQCWDVGDSPDDGSHSEWFSVDGPGGERITAVGGAGQKGMKLRTNHNREVYFGERGRFGEERECDNRFDIPEGYRIAGVALSFADPCGYNQETKAFTFCRMSSLAVLIKR